MYENTSIQHSPKHRETIFITGDTEIKYKHLLNKGWRKEELNKYIKEKMLEKRKKQTSHSLRFNPSMKYDVQTLTQPTSIDISSTQIESSDKSTCKASFIKLINIDSRFRTNLLNTQSNDFSINLNYTLRNVISMRLHEIEIPNSWYTFSDEIQNNTMKIIDHNVAPPETHAFVLPNGNYDFITLKAALESTLSDKGVQFGTLATLNVNINTGKVIIVSPNNTPIALNFWNKERSFDVKNEDYDPVVITRTFGWIIGYRKNEYAAETQHNAEALIDISGTRYIYLSIDENKNNLNDFVIGNLWSSYLNQNIIARITLTNDKYQVINNNTTNTDLKDTQTRFYPQPVKIDRLRFKLFDEFGKLLNLNGMDVSMTLEFTMENENMPFFMHEQI